MTKILKGADSCFETKNYLTQSSGNHGKARYKPKPVNKRSCEEQEEY